MEVSVESVAGARVAAAAGAARVELCAGLSDGGLTPSAALIEAASALVEVHVLVRPRPGDFHYTADELDLVVRDIAVAREHGATGVVVGALTGDGRVDDGCAAFVAAAEGMQTTFHRAIDVSADSRAALDRVAALGFTRVLTSGRRRSALDGAPLIKELVAQAGDRIEVMACGGVRAANAARAPPPGHGHARRGRLVRGCRRARRPRPLRDRSGRGGRSLRGPPGLSGASAAVTQVPVPVVGSPPFQGNVPPIRASSSCTERNGVTVTYPSPSNAASVPGSSSPSTST